MHIPPSDLHVHQPGQDEIESAPRLTFGQIHTLAKTLKTDLSTVFKGDVPADTLSRISQPKFASVMMPYQPVIDWYTRHTTRPCRCGCGTRLPEGQAFATPTCRTRLAIMKERRPRRSGRR
jgi:hypothetical protein